MNNPIDAIQISRSERTGFHWSFIRIGLWASLAATILLTGLGFWSYQQTNQLVEEAQDQSASAFASGLASAIEGQVIVRDYAQIELQLTQAMNSEHIRSIVVGDSEGTILANIARDPSGKVSLLYNDAGNRLSGLKASFIRKEDSFQIINPIGHTLKVGWIMLDVTVPRDTALLQGIHKQLLIIISLGAALMVSIVALSLRRTYSQVKTKQDEIENLNESLQLAAFFDPLTRLPNRHLLKDRLNQALAFAARTHHIVAVCYLDLDGFKEVNDRYGHDAGDTVLIEVAKRLSLTIRQHDTVARIGGDEFVIVLNNLENMNNCHHLMDRILIEMVQPIDIAHHFVNVSASIGISFTQQDGYDPQQLVTRADKAMYQAKKNGKNQWYIFSASV